MGFAGAAGSVYERMAQGHQRKNCKICKRPVEECGDLSARYLCQDCAHERIIANIVQLNQHEGWFFEHWRRRHAASVGGILVDDLIEGS